MTTWHEIADELAKRMFHHARCDAHPEREADPDNCPFCADRAAYRAWERKSGQTCRLPEGRGQVFDVFDSN